MGLHPQVSAERQPGAEDGEDAKVFPLEFANSRSRLLSFPFSSHSFQLKPTKISLIKYFSKFSGFFYDFNWTCM